MQPRRRGRPLSDLSKAVLGKIAADGAQTSAQLAIAIKLNKIHAARVCSELHTAGHLRVVGREGRCHVYAEPASSAPFMWIGVFR